MSLVKYDKKPLIESTDNTTYEYEAGKIETTKIKIKVRGTQSRYETTNMINIRVQFWSQGDYNADTGEYEWYDGNYQNISIIPYEKGLEVNYKSEEIDLNGSYIKSITIIGNATELKIYKESIQVTDDNFENYYEKYSGGSSSGGGGEVPVFNDLVIYNTDNKFDIVGIKNVLRFHVKIPDKYFIADYADELVYTSNGLTLLGYKIKIAWEVTSRNGYNVYNNGQGYIIGIGSSAKYSLSDEIRFADNREEYNYYVNGIESVIDIYGSCDDVLDVKCYFSSHPEIYANAVVTVSGNNITSLGLKLDTDDNKIHSTDTITANILVGNDNDVMTNKIFNISAYKYDTGEVTLSGSGMSGYGSKFYINGVTNGKVKISVSTKSGVPNYLEKDFILDVVGIIKKITYPDSNEHWLLVKNYNRNCICMITYNSDNVTKIIYNNFRTITDATFSFRAYYTISSNKETWEFLNSVTNGTELSNDSSIVYASDVPVYNSNGELVVEATSSYDDINIDDYL